MVYSDKAETARVIGCVACFVAAIAVAVQFILPFALDALALIA